ncbi:MAG: hypothetical protein MZV65_18975 [Chromatiales bacterium]|nr:hypothetical protein [Chromatiales bacterium]
MFEGDYDTLVISRCRAALVRNARGAPSCASSRARPVIEHSVIGGATAGWWWTMHASW